MRAVTHPHITLSAWLFDVANLRSSICVQEAHTMHTLAMACNAWISALCRLLLIINGMRQPELIIFAYSMGCPLPFSYNKLLFLSVYRSFPGGIGPILPDIISDQG
jgi:hypothetical protein